MGRAVDSRSTAVAYGTKGNIVPQDRDEGGAFLADGVAVGIVEDYRVHKIVRDAATGASGLLTDDSSTGAVGITSSTLNCPPGLYDVYVRIRHPSTANANRSLIVQHVAANLTTVTKTLETFLADGPTGEVRSATYHGVRLVAGGGVRIITGSDATNADTYVELLVQRVGD